MNILVSVKWQGDPIQTFHLNSQDLSKKSFTISGEEASFPLPYNLYPYLIWARDNQVYIFNEFNNEILELNDKPITITIGDFSFLIEENEEKSKYPPLLDRKGIGGFLFSSLVHATLLLIFFFLTPPFDDAEANQFNSSTLYSLQQELKTESEKDIVPIVGSSEGISSAKEESNEISKSGGNNTATKNNNPGKLQSNSSWEDLGRGEILQDVSSFGMISMISGLPNGDPDKWGAPFSDGNDPFGVPNGLDGFQIGGLDLGQNGGNDKYGKGIHLSTLSALNCSGPNCLGLPSLTRNLKHNTDAPPKMRPEAITSLEGRLPADVIQRIVRQNFGRFRFCYENALRTNPEMSGRVVINFVIGRDGSVGSASASAQGVSPEVASCVARGAVGMSFPAPEGGIVRVSYPLILSPN